MITIKELESQIKVISDEIFNTQLKKADETRLRNKISFLRQCIMYLKSNPSAEFVCSEINRLDKKISAIMSRVPDSFNKESLKEFKKMYDIPKLRTQLRTLRFLSAGDTITVER